MRSFPIFFILFLIITSPVIAQKKTNRYSFHSINSLVLVNGSNSVSAALQSLVGISRGPWFGGVGAGLDYYLYRTIPLFVDLRREWGKTKNKFFVYADGGINLSWVQEDFYIEPIIWNGNRTNSYKNGLYTDAGIGYAVWMKNGDTLILSLGHSLKKVKENITYREWRNQEWQTDVNVYRLNRIMIKLGWRF